MTYQSEGKRINWSKNFKNYVHYVAGAQSNLEFGDHVENRIGFDTSAAAGREHHQKHKAQRRDNWKVHRRSKHAMTQRLISRQGKLNRLATDGKSGCRHKTDKVVNPKGGVRKSHSGKRQRNLSKCSNCGDPDHTANLCPIARKRLKMAPKSNGRRKGEQFPVDDFDSMWDLN